MESDNVHSLPLIGEPTPAFKAVTTQGEKSLSDYKGSWVVLFSHPADFTPVCSTEFMAFARLQEEFKKRNVQLIGLSIDSVHAHLAWLQDLEFMSSIKIDFPVIADLDMKVSQAYGMIHPRSLGHLGRSRSLCDRHRGHTAGYDLLSAHHRPQHARDFTSGRRLAVQPEDRHGYSGRLAASPERHRSCTHHHGSATRRPGQERSVQRV